MNCPDPADYEYTKGLSPTLWAWEFVRRNNEFIEDWQREYEKEKHNILPNDYPMFEPSVDFTNKWRIGGIVFPPHCRAQLLIEKLTIFGNPQPETWGSRVCFPLISPEKSLEYPFKKIKVPKDHVAIVLNLKKDLFLQWKYVQTRLEIVKKILRIPETTQPSEPEKKLPFSEKKGLHYLLVFDARENGFSNKDIAPVIYKDKSAKAYSPNRAEKSVHDDYNKAKKLIYSDFRKIIAAAT